MSCDHVGPGHVIEMVERQLLESARKPHEGMRFRWSENHDGFFAAAITEVERRGDSWVVVRLDRLKDPLPETEIGFREIESA